jgi:hypothetical protein
MNPDNPHERWLHVLPLVVIAALAIALWQPAAETAPSREQELTMDDLTAVLGSRSSSADDIDNRLRSFGRFPAGSDCEPRARHCTHRLWDDDPRRAAAQRVGPATVPHHGHRRFQRGVSSGGSDGTAADSRGGGMQSGDD